MKIHIWDPLMSNPGHPRTLCGLFTGGRIRAELPRDATCKRCKANAATRAQREKDQAATIAEQATEN